MAYVEKAAVQELLRQHSATLVRCAREAVELWENQVAPLLPLPLGRTRAAFISNAFYNSALAAFSQVTGVLTVEDNERLLLVFGGVFVMRFKLVDGELRTRNYPTFTSTEMDAQREIDIAGVGHLPRVVFGYRMGGVPTRLLDLWVFHAIEQNVLWHYDPEDDAYQLELPIHEKSTGDAGGFRKKGEPAAQEEAEDEDETGSTE